MILFLWLTLILSTGYANSVSINTFFAGYFNSDLNKVTQYTASVSVYIGIPAPLLATIPPGYQVGLVILN